ncbi:hypothetical protein THOG05_40122 [Vibrio rotiferianus]|nr:hypothetical protein THOG05_40122 [Vibrio rotiferianus]
MSFCHEVSRMRTQQTFYSLDCAKTGELNYFDKKGNKTLTFP